ncbi:hypothetical protein Tco_1127907 [Tanacetum coccineum]
MSTEMELTLEQTQQGGSYEVSYDESNTYVLERFNTTAGNPVKEILLKLNLPDHSDEVLKLKNFKKDATLKLFKSTNQERLLVFFIHDRAMYPLTPHYERKTRADQGMKRPCESNASSSSTAQNHPSLSRPLDHMVDENDDESFHSNSSYPSQQVSSSSNVASRVRQNLSHESYDFNTFLSETITLQTQQRNAHREGLRSIGQALKNMIEGKRK